MGQYYKVLLLGNRFGSGRTMYPLDFGNGLKLTESAWVGNTFINHVLSLLTESPRRVAWMGDYSADEYGDEWDKLRDSIMPHEKFQKLYEKVWLYDKVWSKDEKTPYYPKQRRLSLYEWVDGKTGYLVNLSKRVYVDLAANYERNRFNGDWCVSPLPHLTACGNGRGGGDYWEKYPDYDKVGTWAFDLIQLVQYKWEIPCDCTEVQYGFKEEW